MAEQDEAAWTAARLQVCLANASLLIFAHARANICRMWWLHTYD